MENKEIVEHLIRMRAAGARNYDLARRLGCSPGYLSEVITGKKQAGKDLNDSLEKILRLRDWGKQRAGESNVCSEPPTAFVSLPQDQKRSSQAYAESLFAQLTDSDMDEVIADMLERIKSAKARKNEVFSSLSEAGKQELIEEFRERIRRLEAQEAGTLPLQEKIAVTG